MVRVVFLKSRAHFRGGLEKYTHYLLKAFAKAQCSVTLLTTGNVPVIEGVEVHSLAPDSKISYLQLTRFNHLCKEWLKKHPHEIVFGLERTTEQTHYRAGNGVHAVFLKRRKLIDPLWKQCTFFLNPLHRKLLSLEREAFESPRLQKLFTNSSMVRNEILNFFETPPEKIEVVTNGVEWRAWEDCFEKSFDRERKALFQLLFVGNGYKRKGLFFLLQGLHLLKNEDFHLTVIGKEKNPSFFKEWAEKNGLKNKVSFLGPQTDILPFYQQADALVIPSIYDPCANVTLEALAMGLFVTSSTYNGAKEVLKPHTGLVIEDLSSPSSIAQALQKTFDYPKTIERARSVRESIKDLDFSNQLDKIVSKTLESY